MEKVLSQLDTCAVHPSCYESMNTVLGGNCHLFKGARGRERCTSLGEGSRWRCEVDLDLTLEVQGRLNHSAIPHTVHAPALTTARIFSGHQIEYASSCLFFMWLHCIMAKWR
ncbi:hypothetical protein DV515_00012180 [Chloebia gouldiae]|uniref:Uncharacterized protein n=1 Tax=Chloebia gouldiae TaxID=44316 RepID=A0A3L8S461_CHLGU|nr:hypothetical protein DV515_00012180 [Chloebia gouldiae]